MGSDLDEVATRQTNSALSEEPHSRVPGTGPAVGDVPGNGGARGRGVLAYHCWTRPNPHGVPAPVKP